MRPFPLFLALALAAAPAAAAAQVRPQPGSGDPRLQTVDYNEEQVVQLEVAAGYQLTVELAPDEQIENIAVGDSGAWQVTANHRGDRLFIKPLQSGTATNMTVVTNVRHYAFDLVPSYAGSGGGAYYVRFHYPGAANDEEAAATAQALPEGRYRLTGARSLRPSAISDDGRRTFIEWPATTPLPAVYGIDALGRETLINGAMRDGQYVIDEVLPRLVFRVDRRAARAERLPAEGGE